MPVAGHRAAAVQAHGQQRSGRGGLRDPARPAGDASRGSRSSPRTTPVDDGLGPRPTRREHEHGGRPLAGAGAHGGRLRAAGRLRPAAPLPLGRAKGALESSECGSFLLFDFYNIRYTTQTWIGGALGDKMIRYALLARDKDPVLWDFGSAVKHHKIYSQWVPEENYRAGFLGFRGAVAPTVGLMGRRGRGDQVAAGSRPGLPTCRSAWTSSSRRSSSRCSGRA